MDTHPTVDEIKQVAQSAHNAEIQKAITKVVQAWNHTRNVDNAAYYLFQSRTPEQLNQVSGELRVIREMLDEALDTLRELKVKPVA